MGIWEAGKQDLLGKLTENDTRMAFGGEVRICWRLG